MIGAEARVLVYDAWSGMDPDSFAAGSGTLFGGGLLLILTPPPATWPGRADPQSARIANWPHGPKSVTGRFIARFARVLADQPDPLYLQQGARLPRIDPDEPALCVARPSALHPTEPATRDQGRAVDAVLRTARGRAHRPLVLVAHRGRGKSAALGIAAGRLMASGASGILVTAPRRAACDALFHHAALAWPDAERHGGALVLGERSIRFLPPDLLCAALSARTRAGRERRAPPGVLDDAGTADRARGIHGNLLLVDEAAAIPVPLLTDLLVGHPRVVFATTVHGYEGTGRGFDLRFRSVLEGRTPGWRALTLEEPIRWATGDPLEALVLRACLLDAAPVASPRPEGTGEVRRLDRDALATDDHSLRQVFGLLVLAHYQTRPQDLRFLLDAPATRIYAILDDGDVLATLVATEEGGITDPTLRQAIFEGRRRPRGHLIPQTLSAHAGLPEATGLRYLRVVRIAVHPELTRSGLGRRLFEGLVRDAQREDIDLVGASFGATPELIAFWSACDCRPVQVGNSRNAASGEHAVVMLRAVSARGERFLSRAEAHLERRLVALLPGPLCDLEPQVAATLVAALGTPPPAEDQDAAGLQALAVGGFVRGHRTLDASLPALADWTRRRLGPALRAGRIEPSEAALLIASARQLREPRDLVAGFGEAGRDALIARLRRAAGRLAPADTDQDGDPWGAPAPAAPDDAAD
jgi:tRNA(Met) cytidine acetyltransferase